MEKARFTHDCDKCNYLGRHNEFDLYFCATEPTVIARYGEEADYKSGMGFAYKYVSEPLFEAKRRAVEMGLYDIVLSKCKVVMTPTRNSSIWFNEPRNEFFFTGGMSDEELISIDFNDDHINQQLHLTLMTPLKVGDWCSLYGQPSKVLEVNDTHAKIETITITNSDDAELINSIKGSGTIKAGDYGKMIHSFYKDGLPKIVATTDQKLIETISYMDYISLRKKRNELRDSIQNETHLEYTSGKAQIKEWDVILSEYENPLPRLSDDFVKAFVEAKGDIGEIEVELNNKTELWI